MHRSYIFSYDWPKKVFCIYLTFLYIIMHFLAQWPLWLVLATNRLKIWAVTHRGLKYHPMASNSDTRTSCLLTHVYIYKSKLGKLKFLNFFKVAYEMYKNLNHTKIPHFNLWYEKLSTLCIEICIQPIQLYFIHDYNYIIFIDGNGSHYYSNSKKINIL